MKVEDSVWRCTFPVADSVTGECDASLIQQQMEAHLREEHRLNPTRPSDVVPHFVLQRTAEVRRGGVRLGKTEDQTMTMFEKGKDFR